MSEAPSPSLAPLSSRFFRFLVVLFLTAVLFYHGGNAFGQGLHYPPPHGTHYGTQHYPRASVQPAAQPEGIRNVFVKMSPQLTALRETVLNNREAIPAPELPATADGKHPAVGRIDVEGAQGVVYHGSGTLVGVSDTNGIVLTNWHVVRDRVGEVRVRFPDGSTYVATVVATDQTWDLAALSIARPNIHPVAVSDRVPGIGDPLTVAGYGGGEYRQSSGRMLQYCAPGMTEPEDILEVTTPSRSGDSGGPIFHHDGSLAGVLFGSYGGTTNGSHCVRVRKFLEPISLNPAYAIHTLGGKNADGGSVVRGQQL